MIDSLRTIKARLLFCESVMITFTKVDGSERVMKCTLRSDVVDKYTFSLENKGKPPLVLKENQIRVWDLEKDAWRIVNYDTIKLVQYHFGKTFFDEIDRCVKERDDDRLNQLGYPMIKEFPEPIT